MSTNSQRVSEGLVFAAANSILGALLAAITAPAFLAVAKPLPAVVYSGVAFFVAFCLGCIVYFLHQRRVAGRFLALVGVLLAVFYLGGVASAVAGVQSGLLPGSRNEDATLEDVVEVLKDVKTSLDKLIERIDEGLDKIVEIITDERSPRATTPATNTPTPAPPATSTRTTDTPATTTSTPASPATSTPTPALPATNTPTPPPSATSTQTLTPPATNTMTPSPPATNTPTPMPPATDTPTLTPPATDTPTSAPPATRTSTPPSIPKGTNNLAAKVYIDYRCDRFYQERLDIPLEGVSVTMSFSNGSSEMLQTTSFGMVEFTGFDVSGGVTVSVDLPASYRGHPLTSCRNSPTNIELLPEDFNFGFKFVQFGISRF